MLRLTDKSINLTLMEANIVAAAQICPPVKVESMFRSMVYSQEFSQNVWQRGPFLLESQLINLQSCYLINDVKNAVDSEFF